MAFDEDFSELANSVQTALLLAAGLSRRSTETAREADELLTALDRVASALRRLRPTEGRNGGAQ